jgi:tetratricopeptide (TPR) repeat protein
MLLSLLLLACAPKVPPEQDWYAGERDRALEAQKALAAEEGRERAMHNLRLASMALAAGDNDLAEASLRFAVGRMQDFRAEGEFQGLLISEESKEWKGEPYEKVGAFFTLGMLLYQEGDRGNALAMFKSAVIADAGTTEERYRSDFVPAYVLQALVYQAEGEPHNAETSMGRAVDAIYARELTEMLSEQLTDVDTSELDPEAAAHAKVFLLSGVAAGVTVAPRDPAEAARAAVSQATDIANVQRNLDRGDRRPEFKGLSGRDFEDAFGAMGPIAEQWRAAAEAIPEGALKELEARGAQLERLLEEAPNVVLVVESGQGPRKVATGEYGEVLRIVPSRRTAHPPRVSLDASGAAEAPQQTLAAPDPDNEQVLALPAFDPGWEPDAFEPLFLDSYTWQGTTRGSRKVDGFLKGKAIYKDASFVGGVVLDVLGDVASASNNDTLAAAFEIAALALYVSGAVTNPEADTREWGLMPDGLYLVAGELPPGEQQLSINGRRYTLEVPERGQLVALVPALTPGGASVIAPR